MRKHKGLSGRVGGLGWEVERGPPGPGEGLVVLHLSKTLVQRLDHHMAEGVGDSQDGGLLSGGYREYLHSNRKGPCR